MNKNLPTEYILENNSEIYNFKKNKIISTSSPKTAPISSTIESKKSNILTVWGEIRDIKGTLLKDTSVELLKVIQKDTNISYEQIASTKTNMNGVYYFEVSNTEKANYKVVIKTVT
ncbi:MAG: hypothetical protein ACRDAU_07230 [Clostridium sp.]